MITSYRSDSQQGQPAMFNQINSQERPEIYARNYDNMFSLVVTRAGFWYVCEFQTADSTWTPIYFAGKSFEDAQDVFGIYNDDMDALIFMFNQPAESPVYVFEFVA
jgi:hypothetical protein